MIVPTAITSSKTNEDIFSQMHQEALEALEAEPEMSMLLQKTVLAPCAKSFEEAIAATVGYRLLQMQVPNENECFCPNVLNKILLDALRSEELEGGHTMAEAVKEDILAVFRRDPACDTLLEVVLFYKGFAALVSHRAARRKWFNRKKRSFTALWLQSQASAVFGVDIHPAATVGAGILLDHGTGVVIGETAHLGDGCTLLHGVTLGGTGKDHGDRHPKVGNNVLIGAGASILGNIKIGESAKIGAGSIVLRAIPSGATAVGAPAKIIGRALESKPGSEVDDTLQKVGMLHKSESVSVMTSLTSQLASEEESESGRESNGVYASLCPYRAYDELAKTAPKGALTITMMRKLLAPEKVDGETIGTLVFEMDSRNVGYIHPDEFKERAPSVFKRFTSFSEEKINEIMARCVSCHTERT